MAVPTEPTTTMDPNATRLALRRPVPFSCRRCGPTPGCGQVVGAYCDRALACTHARLLARRAILKLSKGRGRALPSRRSVSKAKWSRLHAPRPSTGPMSLGPAWSRMAHRRVVLRCHLGLWCLSRPGQLNHNLVPRPSTEACCGSPSAASAYPELAAGGSVTRKNS